MGREPPTVRDRSGSAGESDRLQLRQPKRDRQATEIEGHLVAALGHLQRGKETGEAAYREELDWLREHPDDIRTGIETVGRSAPDDIELQWNLHYVAAGIESPELAPMLVDSATRDLPEITADTPCESVDEARVLVAIMAVEGLEGIGSKDPDTAAEALAEVIERQTNIAVRTAAVQALLSIRGNSAEEIGRLLPDDQRFLLQVRRAAIDQVTAIPERGSPGRLAQRSPKLPADRNAPQERTE